jgi:hypothetical protein
MDIHQWLKENCKIEGSYSIDENGYVNVNGNAIIIKQITKIPIKFGIVTRYFDCSYNQLTSLEGGPKEVGGHFSCSFNQLTSLEGAPNKVGGSFYCTGNQLTSLKGIPEKIRGKFYCDDYLKDTYEYKWWKIKRFLKEIK